MENIQVTITPEDFRDAPGGYRNTDLKGGCVLWRALVRKFPQTDVRVSVTIISVNGKYYSIDTSVWGVGSQSPDETQYHPDLINELSQKAKQSLEGIPTITLTLKSHTPWN